MHWGGDFGMGLADYARQVDAGVTTFQGDAGEMPNLDPADGWRVFGQGQLFVPDLDAAESIEQASPTRRACSMA